MFNLFLSSDIFKFEKYTNQIYFLIDIDTMAFKVKGWKPIETQTKLQLNLACVPYWPKT